jgi:hypothetical protein
MEMVKNSIVCSFPSPGDDARRRARRGDPTVGPLRPRMARQGRFIWQLVGVLDT